MEHAWVSSINFLFQSFLCVERTGAVMIETSCVCAYLEVLLHRVLHVAGWVGLARVRQLQQGIQHADTVIHVYQDKKAVQYLQKWHRVDGS